MPRSVRNTDRCQSPTLAVMFGRTMDGPGSRASSHESVLLMIDPQNVRRGRD